MFLSLFAFVFFLNIQVIIYQPFLWILCGGRGTKVEKWFTFNCGQSTKQQPSPSYHLTVWRFASKASVWWSRMKATGGLFFLHIYLSVNWFFIKHEINVSYVLGTSQIYWFQMCPWLPLRKHRGVSFKKWIHCSLQVCLPFYTTYLKIVFRKLIPLR